MRSRDRPLAGESAEFNGGPPASTEQGLRIPEHTHAGHIYTDRDEQLGVAVSFFKASLDDRLRCVYIHDELDDTRALQGLARAGLDVNQAIQSTALELADPRLLPALPGSFDIEGLFDFARSQIARAQAAGYAGVRGVGDMGWALAPDPGLNRLSQYESQCTAFFKANPASAICQYDRQRFDAGALLNVVREHPLLIIGDTPCRNPYYVPMALTEREQGTIDLDRLLGNVLARERQERWLAAAEVGLEAHEPDIRTVDVRHLAGIYEHMRDYKRGLRDRVGWRLDRQLGGRRSPAGRIELIALDAEIHWLEGRASLWRRRELQSSGLSFDSVSGTVGYRGGAVGLSRLEAALLRALLEQAGRPRSAADLLRTAWEGDLRSEAQLRNYIVRLRAKLEALNLPASITTLRGRGYCLTTGISPGQT